MKNWYIIMSLLLLGWSCTSPNVVEDEQLPILGETEVVNGETIYHTVPSFSFLDQDSTVITKESLKDKVHIADFFFTSCPTICPKMTKQMKRLHDTFLNNPEVALLSFSIDPKRDTVGRLKWYAESIGVNTTGKWHFLTGNKDEIYAIADDYFSIAIEDGDAPEGFDHSGRFILVDKEGRVRSFADGTNPEEVDRLMLDIEKLLEEYQEEGVTETE